MKANNLTICIDASCNKNCPYCISKMTWNPAPDQRLFERNIYKAKQMAELASVSSVLFTSKGETLNNLPALFYSISIFKNFPLEIQTNGILLQKDLIHGLYNAGLNVIAISIDKYAHIPRFEEVFETCNKLGLIVRLTIVLTDLWKGSADQLVKKCKKYNIKQLTFRHATTPGRLYTSKEGQEIAEWVDTHVGEHEGFLNYFRREYQPINLIRTLPFGSSVYGKSGLSFTEIDYCIQEFNNTEDIRSLIYHHDGHMYTSWDKPESILF